MACSVITFYSFKGGVGRSFAAANIGVILAQWGARVLAVDFDVEAPGLHHYFAPFASNLSAGVLEFLDDCRRGEPRSWQSYQVPILLPDGTKGLHLMPATAGGDVGYADRVQQLDWDALYSEHGLGVHIEALRAEWTKEFDFVLVDSRTGLTDFSGLTTAQLPDILAFFFTANVQSLQGCTDIAMRAMEARRRMPIDRPALLPLPIPARFEQREEYELAQAWRDRFAITLTPFLNFWASANTDKLKLIDLLTIPYVPRWTFGEELAVLQEPASPTGGTRTSGQAVSFALETLAALLVNRVGKTELLVSSRDEFVHAARAAVRSWRAVARSSPRIFISHTHEDYPIVKKIIHELQAAGLTPWMDSSHLSDGKLRQTTISNALENVDGYIVVVGSSFQSSRFVQSEVEAMLRESLRTDVRKAIVPVVLPGGEEMFATSRLSDFQAVFVDPARDNLARQLSPAILRFSEDAGVLTSGSNIELKVYDNGDHTCLVWLPANGKAIPNCRGFTIHRMLKPSAGGPVKDEYLHGFVGFSDDDKLDPNAPWKYPLQRYMWWDYRVSPGDVVQYSIVPVVGPSKNQLKLSTADASAQTPPMTITGQASAHISAYFNKGIVSAQWVSRALALVPKGAKLDNLIAQTGNSLRNALSGLLRPQLLNMLDEVKKNDGEIYAALYELNDPELIPRLTALGQKCHLILANGTFNSKKRDENKDVREKLRGTVDLHDRLVGPGHFAHNKFLVACDSAGKPQRVLSGSTNWTKTGLCTQANNGVIIDDPDLGAHFIDQWNMLKAAGNVYPASLMQANSTSKSFNVDGGSITQWFAPTDKGEDLDYARKLINAAEQGILFLFFNPGEFLPADKPERWSLLQNILVRHQQGAPNYNGNLYIRGVVNQEIVGLTTKDPEGRAAAPFSWLHAPAPVKLYSGGKNAPLPVSYQSMVPKAIKDTFSGWSSELMTQGVHVHSTVVVIDPFSKKPIVITGSHNLRYKASTKDDNNMMIVERNAPLAASYAINILGMYQTYRWNTYVEAQASDPSVWHGLVDNATWQDSYLNPSRSDLAEIKFWLGEGRASGLTVGQVHVSTASGSSLTVQRGRQKSGSGQRAQAKTGSLLKKPSTEKGSAKKKRSAKKYVKKVASAKSMKASIRRAPTKAKKVNARESHSRRPA
jgi:phosphatidylserine/phosphatidylglycerophosphate/cardiolipin synthase-like enzyme